MKKNPKYRYTHIPHAYTHIPYYAVKTCPPHQKKKPNQNLRLIKPTKPPAKCWFEAKHSTRHAINRRTILELILPD